MPWVWDGILKHIHLLTTGSPVMQHGIYIKNYDSTYFSGCKNIFGSPLSAYYFLARDKYMFYVTIKLQCFDVKLWKQVFCLHKWTDGRGQLLKLFLGKGFPWGHSLAAGRNRNLLRLLTILERMTNNNRVGSNVDLFCKLDYNFDQNGPGQGWFNPVLLPLLFSSLLFSP